MIEGFSVFVTVSAYGVVIFTAIMIIKAIADSASSRKARKAEYQKLKSLYHGLLAEERGLEHKLKNYLRRKREMMDDDLQSEFEQIHRDTIFNAALIGSVDTDKELQQVRAKIEAVRAELEYYK